MKSILSTNPTFTPGAVNTGTLNFSSVNGFNIAGLLAVLNQTRGTLLYATGQASTGYFSWNNSTKVLTLKVDTSTHSSGDQLQVIYDGPNSSGPAQSAVISGVVTDQQVTNQPAVIVSIALIPGPSMHQNFTYATIKTGSTTILNLRAQYFGSAGNTYNWLDNRVFSDGGLDCPSGIYVTTQHDVYVNIAYKLK